MILARVCLFVLVKSRLSNCHCLRIVLQKLLQPGGYKAEPHFIWPRKMGEPQGSYAANFTSTANDACDVCGDKAVLKYMHHKNPKKAGHYLCPKCYNKYLNKEGTVSRSSSGISQLPSATMTEQKSHPSADCLGTKRQYVLLHSHLIQGLI
jgi:hypothetical protein